MNNSSQDERGDIEQYDLLDQLTQRLREQSVPPLPEDCQHWVPKSAVETQPQSKKKRIHLRWLAAAAAIVIGMVSWSWSRSPKEVIVDKTPVTNETMQAVSTGRTKHLDEIRRGLDELDREITELKRQAALLDAQRKAEAMMNRMATLGSSTRSIVDES